MARTPLRQLRLVNSADVYKAGVLAGTLRRLHDRTEWRDCWQPLLVVIQEAASADEGSAVPRLRHNRCNAK